MLRLNNSQFNKLQSLFFHIGPTTFEFVANAQIWPRVLNTLIGGTSGNAYLIVGSVSTLIIYDFCYQFIGRNYFCRPDKAQDQD